MTVDATPDAMDWLRAQVTRDKERAEGMEHFTVHEQPYYSCPATRTQDEAGDLEWGEDACDCFVAGRRAEALADAEAKLAGLDICQRVLAEDAHRIPAGEGWTGLAVARIWLQFTAAGYRHRGGYAEHWGSAG